MKKTNTNKLFEFSKNFRSKFKEHSVGAITAAFAFLIALSWRTPIQQAIDKLISRFSLQGNELLIQTLTALLITLIAVLVLIFLSKWEAKN